MHVADRHHFVVKYGNRLCSSDHWQCRVGIIIAAIGVIVVIAASVVVACVVRYWNGFSANHDLQNQFEVQVKMLNAHVRY